MRKGSCVIYEGKFYRVQQKKGNTVIFYDPTSRTPEATMHATSIINVKEARPENGYIITQYTTPAGAMRVEIRPAKDPTWPWLDIPFMELHAHVLEILKTTSGAWFMDQRTTTACEYIPDYIQPDQQPEESTNAQEGPTAHESNTDEETTTGANKATEEATQRPQEATTRAGTNTDTETPTNGETAPQEATSEATTAPDQDNTNSTPEATQERPTTAGTVPGEQDNTGSDARPPRAQEANQEPGHAAGDHYGQAADHITGPTAGNTSGAAAEAITGRTTTPPQNPCHACENAPGRTERAQAEQVHTQHAKSPPRAAQKAGNRSPSKGPQPQKQVFGPNVKFRKIYLGNFDPPQFSSGIFPIFKTLFVRPISRYPLGRSKWFTDGAAKNFQKFLRRTIKWDVTRHVHLKKKNTERLSWFYVPGTHTTT